LIDQTHGLSYDWHGRSGLKFTRCRVNRKILHQHRFGPIDRGLRIREPFMAHFFEGGIEQGVESFLENFELLVGHLLDIGRREFDRHFDSGLG
jgi:hypothetical protein